jgi:ribosomal protein L31E
VANIVNSHPDVAILLTCISFYYGGLELSQLQQSLEQVLRSDNPSSEYDRWMKNAKSVPESLRAWNAVNLDDEFQIQKLWKHLKFTMIVIDYYLNNFVFPRHAKQFQRKLQASG